MMVARNTAWPAGTPCWVDLAVDDVRRAAEFYSGLFGWQVEFGTEEVGGYSMCTKDGKAAAGIGQKQSQEQPTVWTTYLAAEDVDKTAAVIAQAGGRLLTEPFDVMDAGRMLIAVDPTGVAVGVWQAGKHIGAEVANEPSAFVWNEHLSRDLAGAKRFYETVFGYGYEAVPDADGDYAIFSVNGATAGGLGVLPEYLGAEAPVHWLAYFEVPDVDTASVTVGELGGRVIRPATDTPYGRIALVHDNHGAALALITNTTQ